MARITLVTCDRCKRNCSDDTDGVVQVRVYLGSTPGYITQPVKGADWCLRCRTELGLVAPTTPVEEGAKSTRPEPTLESLIREIVQEEIDYANA